MALADYFGNPLEWGEHGRKMTAWLNELVSAVRYSHECDAAQVDTSESTSSTTFTALSTELEITVPLPTSRKILTVNSAQGTGTAGYMVHTIEVEVGGVVVKSAADERAAVREDATSANSSTMERTLLWFEVAGVTDLAIGTPITFREKVRVESGTGAFSRRRLLAMPV